MFSICSRTNPKVPYSLLPEIFSGKVGRQLRALRDTKKERTYGVFSLLSLLVHATNHTPGSHFFERRFSFCSCILHIYFSYWWRIDGVDDSGRKKDLADLIPGGWVGVDRHKDFVCGRNIVFANG
jgi:hypothetical protein